MEPVFLGVDLGTHGARVVAVSAGGEIVASARRAYHRVTKAGGICEQAADDWWDAFRGAARAVVNSLGKRTADLRALCIAHQRGTIVPVGRNGMPLRPALCDSDARCEFASISAADADADRQAGCDAGHHAGRDAGREVDREVDPGAAHWLYRRTGCPPVPFVGLGKILWVRTHEPEVYSRTLKWLTPHDYLVHKLTGEYVTSNAVALRVGILDVQARDRFAPDVLERCGVDPGSFPKVIPAGSVAGTITDRASAETGLPQGLPVVAGAGDQQCAIIACRLDACGLGACGVDVGRAAFVNLGTSFVASHVVDKLVYDPEGLCTIEVLPGERLYAPELGSGSGTNVFDWFRHEILRVQEADSERIWQDLSERAAHIGPGTRGLVSIPRWWGATESGVTGSIIGIDSGTSVAEMYHAIVEGLAYEVRLSLAGVQRASGAPSSELRVFGGASRNGLLVQVLADVLNLPVTVGPAEASAVGAAMVAASAPQVGVYPDTLAASKAMSRLGAEYVPDGKRAALYDDLFRKVYLRTKQVAESLSRANRRLTTGVALRG